MNFSTMTNMKRQPPTPVNIVEMIAATWTTRSMKIPTVPVNMPTAQSCLDVEVPIGWTMRMNSQKSSAARIARPETPAMLIRRLRPLHTFLVNKWYFDELIDILVVKPALAIGRAPGGPALAAAEEWELSADGDRVCVTALRPRAQEFVRTPVGARGKIVEMGVTW